MSKRIAICAVAQIKNDPEYRLLRFQNMLLDCLEPIIEQTKVTSTWIRASGTSLPVRMTCSTRGPYPTTE